MSNFIAGGSGSGKTGEPIPNTNYRLYKNNEDAAKIIDDALFAFNKKCVPAILPEKNISNRAE